jgi:thiamine pyrophosphokinase
MKRKNIAKKATDKALIFTAYIENIDALPCLPNNYTVIASDAGYKLARQAGYNPDLMLGDYDTCPAPERADLILPSVKDVSDSEAAVELAFSRNFREIYIIGGLGGRFDHTMGNIGMLAKYAGKFDKIAILDGKNCVSLLLPGTTFISPEVFGRRFTYMGLIAYGGDVSGLTVKGCKYNLSDHILTPDTTLAISNEIENNFAEISFSQGMLLVILSSD